MDGTQKIKAKLEPVTGTYTKAGKKLSLELTPKHGKASASSNKEASSTKKKKDSGLVESKAGGAASRSCLSPSEPATIDKSHALVKHHPSADKKVALDAKKTSTDSKSISSMLTDVKSRSSLLQKEFERIQPSPKSSTETDELKSNPIGGQSKSQELKTHTMSAKLEFVHDRQIPKILRLDQYNNIQRSPQVRQVDIFSTLNSFLGEILFTPS